MEIFDVIKLAYRSRLLFRTEAEYYALTGVSFETIQDHHTDEEEMGKYYHVLNRECYFQCDETLRTMVRSYLKMSRMCGGRDFDWGKRKHIGLRKKFCRWLFRTSTAEVCRVTVEEEQKFKSQDCDGRLVEAIFPDGMTGRGRIDLIFLLLITFGVIPPMTDSRGRDMPDKKLGEQIDAMTDLVRELRDDFPEVGVLSVPVIFNIIMEDLEQKAADMDDPAERAECSVARFWYMLSRIEDACRFVSSPQHISDSRISNDGYIMPGIWVDDHDEGRTRFWIFPDNKLMAFCYHDTGRGWQLEPFEFGFPTSQEDDEPGGVCVIATSEGNRQMIESLKGNMRQSEIVSASYDLDDEEKYWPFGKISFKCHTREHPEWFDWTCFRRLAGDDIRHGGFKEVLKDIYDPESPQSVLLSNIGDFMTDAENALVAIDREFIYVTASVSKCRYILTCRDTDNGERYRYEPASGGGVEDLNLLNVEISEDAPLYLLPRFRKPENRLSASRLRFAEAVRNVDLEHQITIYPMRKCPGGVLCLNNFSLMIPLEPEVLKEYGIRKIVSREELLKAK
ncbi:MAG: hypothetical protein K2O24_09005 [Muribaculaceae bacterium]|nr:hypothetical protein [Muribaculaceae bacterium]